MKNPVGTKTDFNRFMDGQVELYAAHIRHVYGLPDPQECQQSLWQVAQLDPMKFVGGDTDAITTRHLVFEKVRWQMQDGRNFLYWERKSP